MLCAQEDTAAIVGNGYLGDTTPIAQQGGPGGVVGTPDEPDGPTQPRDEDPTIEEQVEGIIDDGHWKEHADDWSEADLDGDGRIEGEDEMEFLEDTSTDIMTDPADEDYRKLTNGRIAYYDPDSERVITYNPDGPSTAFQPDDPREYFDNSEQHVRRILIMNDTILVTVALTPSFVVPIC